MPSIVATGSMIEDGRAIVAETVIGAVIIGEKIADTAAIGAAGVTGAAGAAATRLPGACSAARWLERRSPRPQPHTIIPIPRTLTRTATPIRTITDTDTDTDRIGREPSASLLCRFPALSSSTPSCADKRRGFAARRDQPSRSHPHQAHNASPMTKRLSSSPSQGSSSVNIVTHCRHEHGIFEMSVPQNMRCGPNASKIRRR